MQYSPTGESGMMGMFLVLSLGLHLVFFVLDQLNVFNLMPEFSDEWAIETELVADDGFIPHTSLPDARKKKEVKVSDKTLPQLPRSYKVRKEDKADEGLAKKPAEQDKTGTAEASNPRTRRFSARYSSTTAPRRCATPARRRSPFAASMPRRSRRCCVACVSKPVTSSEAASAASTKPRRSSSNLVSSKYSQRVTRRW